MAKAVQLDFTNVKEGGSFSKRHQPPGDYPGRITKVQDAKSKSDNISMWLFTIEVNGASYPYYCKHQENQLWKIRNICVAAGVNVPKKRVKVDPNKLVGKTIGVTLEDEEYEGKMQSVVQATFPPSELEGTELASDEDEDDEDEESTEPPQSSDDDDDDDDDEPVEKVSKKSKAKKAKKGKKKKDDDDELDELDVDSI